MVSGYVLIFAVLLLGGVIATLGDRIGMRVGKARLSLFNLRPRQTATLVSIATGSIISASTLALLFGISSQLRKGVFELGEIQADLTEAQTELKAAETERDQVKSELASSAEERERARKRLQEINQFLQNARKQQQSTQAQLQQTLQQQQAIQSQLQQTRSQLASVSQQASGLRGEIQRLQAERDSLKQQQAMIQQQIAERDQEIAERDQAIAQREQRLAELETQQKFLSEEVASLERQYEGLFRGNIALRRNQELAAGIFQVNTRAEAAQAVTQLLYRVNQIVIRQIAPGIPLDRQVILISTQEVEQIIQQLQDGQQYVIRVMAAANYIIGEPCVVQQQEPCIQVFTAINPNVLVYEAGERIASTSIDEASFSERQLVGKMNLLNAAILFLARQKGVLAEDVIVSDGRTSTLLAFLEAVQNYGQPLEIYAIAASPIFTAGPLHVDLVAEANGSILFKTNYNPPQPPTEPDR